LQSAKPRSEPDSPGIPEKREAAPLGGFALRDGKKHRRSQFRSQVAGAVFRLFTWQKYEQRLQVYRDVQFPRLNRLVIALLAPVP